MYKLTRIKNTCMCMGNFDIYWISTGKFTVDNSPRKVHHPQFIPYNSFYPQFSACTIHQPLPINQIHDRLKPQWENKLS